MKINGTVDSTAIKSYEYDTDTKTMVIEFKTSGKYNYYDVPRHVVDGFAEAESKGKYFNKFIKAYSIPGKF